MIRLSRIFFLLVSLSIYSQEIIELPYEKSDEVVWNQEEREYYSSIWNKKVITNVSAPTLQVYRPVDSLINGTSVIIAPSGKFFVHKSNNDAAQVAKWLAKKGITAFVLKYRLMPTGKDGVAEIKKLERTNRGKLYERAKKILPLTVEDGLNAIAYVRKNATNLGVDVTKIGLMGFSAGGTLTLGVAESYEEINRPDFLVTIHPWTRVISAEEDPKKDSPPMLIISSNSNVGSDNYSTPVSIYNKWVEEGLNVELHVYSGAESFTMKRTGNDSDYWIDRFYDWSVSEGLVSFNE